VGWGCIQDTGVQRLDLRVGVWQLPRFDKPALFESTQVQARDLFRIFPAPKGDLALLIGMGTDASLNDDSTFMRLWDSGRGKVLHAFPPQKEGWGWEAAAWSPDGKYLLLDRKQSKREDASRTL